MILKKEVKEILAMEQNKIHLCHLVGSSYASVHRWIRDDYEKLTLPRVSEKIAIVTGIPVEDLFETEPVHYHSVTNN